MHGTRGIDLVGDRESDDVGPMPALGDLVDRPRTVIRARREHAVEQKAKRRHPDQRLIDTELVELTHDVGPLEAGTDTRERLPTPVVIANCHRRAYPNRAERMREPWR